MSYASGLGMASSVAPPSGYLHDVLEYDLAQHQWKEVQTHGTSDFRACHVALVYNGRMLVFGGWSVPARPKPPPRSVLNEPAH